MAARIVAEIRWFVAESFIGADRYRRRKGRNKTAHDLFTTAHDDRVLLRLGPSWQSGLGFRVLAESSIRIVHHTEDRSVAESSIRIVHHTRGHRSVAESNIRIVHHTRGHWSVAESSLWSFPPSAGWRQFY